VFAGLIFVVAGYMLYRSIGALGLIGSRESPTPDTLSCEPHEAGEQFEAKPSARYALAAPHPGVL